MASVWPLFGLRLAVGDLELCVPDDDDLVTLGQLAAQGIHPPDRTPFATAWTDVGPERLPLETMRHNWRSRAGVGPARWELPLVCRRDGEVVGVQGMDATDFAVTRSISTGSWLGSPYQGQGIGRGMRTAVLALAFDHLGATEARSGAFEHNEASLRVSRVLGYRDDGTQRRAVRGRMETEQRFLMTLDDWRGLQRPTVLVEGLDACLPLLVGDDGRGDD